MLAGMPSVSADEASLSYGAPSKSAPVLPAADSASPSAGAVSLPAVPFGTPAETAVAQSALERAAARAREALASARPWREFYDSRQMRLPAFSEITERVEKNATVFRGNYEVIAAGWCAFALFLSLGRFLVAALLLFGVERWMRYKVREEGSMSFTEKVFAGAVALCVVWVTGVGKRVVESFGIGCLVMGLHAVLRVPPDVPEGLEMA